MRSLMFATVAVLAMIAMPVLAQAPAAPDAAGTGARAGHEPGVGDSLPRSNKASNIDAADSQSNVAPTLPQSSIGGHGTPRDFLTAARASLVAGRTGQAQQSLEMAETRALDRSVVADQADVQDPSQFVAKIREALHALGEGDGKRAIEIIDLALAG